MAYLILDSGGRLLLEGGGALLLEQSGSDSGYGIVLLQQRGRGVISIFDGQTTFVRGNPIPIIVGFIDIQNAGAAPTAAQAVIKYVASGTPVTATLVLTRVGDTWEATWDSSPADPGAVSITVSCSGPLVVVIDGTITLTAGPANTL